MITYFDINIIVKMSYIRYLFVIYISFNNSFYFQFIKIQLYNKIHYNWNIKYMNQ